MRCAISPNPTPCSSAGLERTHRCVVLTLITLERVVPVGEILESCGLEVETTLLQASRMKGAGTLHRLAPETPVFVVSGYRPGTGSERL